MPRPLFLCRDTTIVGTEFYVMEFVAGRIFRDPTLPQLAPAERMAVYQSMAATLARLHSLDIRTLGLADLARHGQYGQRQLKAWGQAYALATTIGY